MIANDMNRPASNALEKRITLKCLYAQMNGRGLRAGELGLSPSLIEGGTSRLIKSYNTRSHLSAVHRIPACGRHLSSLERSAASAYGLKEALVDGNTLVRSKLAFGQVHPVVVSGKMV
jgi:hypothetical protein